MPLQESDREKLKKFLEEALAELEQDNVHIALGMINGQALWLGNPFATLGWVTHIQEIMKSNLLMASMPSDSKIISPHGGHA